MALPHMWNKQRGAAGSEDWLAMNMFGSSKSILIYRHFRSFFAYFVIVSKYPDTSFK